MNTTEQQHINSIRAKAFREAGVPECEIRLIVNELAELDEERDRKLQRAAQRFAEVREDFHREWMEELQRKMQRIAEKFTREGKHDRP